MTPPEHHEPNTVRYERSDIHARALGYIALGACVGGVLIHFALNAIFASYQAAENRADSAPPPLLSNVSQLPPEPRLETTPSAALLESRRRQQAHLEGYHWTDRKSGSVQIPIARAMELIAERGLPEFKAEPKETAPSKPEEKAPAADRTGAKP